MAKFTVKESETLRQLDKLNKYCKKHYIQENISIEQLELKEQFIATYFIYGLSFSEGVHAQVRKNKPRAAIPTLRALYEAWVNTRLLIDSNEPVWVYNLEAVAAKHTIKDGKQLLENNDYTKKPDEKAEIEKAISGAEKRLEEANKLFKELPLIDKVITQNNNNFSRELRIKEKCKIIDFYSKPKNKKESMEFNYETVSVERKRYLLDFVFSNLKLNGGTLELPLKQPFGAIKVMSDTNDWYQIPEMFRNKYYQAIVSLANEVEMAVEYLGSTFNLGIFNVGEPHTIQL